MGSREDLDVDDDFSELYKEYTGPLGSKATNAQDTTTVTNKRSHAGSDEEEEAHDPYAVPTDFTSREAKVWEAKSKATERNWKKRKEEEMICKICGESGHFTQGCPSTLGANRKTQDFFERVPAREPHVKALFSEKVVNKIEKDIGCKLKLEEKFIIVSGKDRLILKKGVDAVHKIKEEGENKSVHKFTEEGENKSVRKFPEEGEQHKGSSRSPISRSRSPHHRSPATSRLGRFDSQKSNPIPSPHNTTAHNPHRYGRQDKVVEDRVREDLQKLSGGSPQGWSIFHSNTACCSSFFLQQEVTYGNDGGSKGRSSHSKSPARPSYFGNSYSSFEGHSQSGSGGYRTDGWNVERGGSGRNFEYPPFPKTLEELELQHKREAMELARFRDKEEDEENYKHREAIRETRESYLNKIGMLKGTHAKMWEEFLQLEGLRRQQEARQHISSFGYKQPSYPEYDNSSVNLHQSGTSMPIESRGRYSNDAMDSYPPPSRPHETYGDFQRHRRDDFGGKAYNRY
ncbi:hypothetical protein ACJIZ3_004134 [Penstemon smallii]|uniref:CCHC-type domain-containing protein n=1 Tax=Penstemon smallii TaxID=265156 RepID=A0ABD3S159_9LAMI